MNSVKCPLAHCGGFLEFTSVAGEVVENCPRCARRRAGICRDCPSRVEGDVGKAIRCKACKGARRREQDRDRMRDPELHDRRNRLARQRYPKRSAERVAERARYSREWRKAHPDRVKKWKRAYLLKQKPAYLRTQRKWNRDPERAAKKRAAAIAKYYELHPVRPDPHCSGCSVKIDWTPGHGRPRLTCDSCCTPAELRRRRGEYRQARVPSTEERGMKFKPPTEAAERRQRLTQLENQRFLANSCHRRAGDLRALACVHCGCIEDRACPGGCYWMSIAPPVCSRCVT